jgi:hypothetical protein
VRCVTDLPLDPTGARRTSAISLDESPIALVLLEVDIRRVIEH